MLRHEEMKLLCISTYTRPNLVFSISAYVHSLEIIASIGLPGAEGSALMMC